MKAPVKNFLLISILASICFACKKEKFTSSGTAVLITNADTLHFDTVFTTTGSVTQMFKIINNNAQGIKINSVRLAGGMSSPFKMNVDGQAGPLISNVEIASNDSAYLFVTVNINPATTNLPFIVSDSIEISYNGNTKWVQLDAYGQNAHFFRNKTITRNEVWNNDLPYVILGKLTVEQNATLTINEGCRVFVHADAPIIINGTLQVWGDRYDSTKVVFSGDRMDEPYRNFPGAFPGLIFTETSTNNSIAYAVIKNAYQGIVALGGATSVKLSLNETVIDNAYDAGLLGINTSINANNLLVSNCGKNILLAMGGNYDFTHCTIAAYTNSYISHKEPVLQASNFLKTDNTVSYADLNARFRNCIFWGESGGQVQNEVVVTKQGTTNFSVLFENVLWNVANDLAHAQITGSIIRNQDPQFINIKSAERLYDFHLNETSPAIDKGGNTGLMFDLDGKPRPVNQPDLGAYERQ